MVLNIVELQSLDRVSENTLQLFLQTADCRLVEFFSQPDGEKKKNYLKTLPAPKQKEIETYLNIMMNQFYKNNCNYLVLMSSKALSRIQLVHQVAILEDKMKYLIHF